jgi:hypothetical protein
MARHPEAPNHRRHSHLRSTLIRARERRRGDEPVPQLTLGERLSDLVAAIVGSWRFILIQSGLLLAWLIANITLGGGAWDPYPFILLNLMLSFQAAYTAPIIMMSQNRQADIDRLRSIARTAGGGIDCTAQDIAGTDRKPGKPAFARAAAGLKITLRLRLGMCKTGFRAWPPRATTG